MLSSSDKKHLFDGIMEQKVGINGKLSLTHAREIMRRLETDARTLFLPDRRSRGNFLAKVRGC